MRSSTPISDERQTTDVQSRDSRQF